ncbi:Hypothetical protein ORPV_622 [Orpheovirus IHUMI-LCC2]|uniref:Uncharacterized protein n=1 Tax=Orpheovirus IHUMI-LCC2 TaxID=2023057 RepID=A0A2I2L4S5_9VIRU|nr:Hypothetical protein ORPV_622 [Orpheovirus IHUMI-LCC2]SNW62526.1 Hypothetical protein ORPV_622 [Orpheovirus IHUMI-LCC2]
MSKRINDSEGNLLMYVDDSEYHSLSYFFDLPNLNIGSMERGGVCRALYSVILKSYSQNVVQYICKLFSKNPKATCIIYYSQFKDFFPYIIDHILNRINYKKEYHLLRKLVELGDDVKVDNVNLTFVSNKHLYTLTNDKVLHSYKLDKIEGMEEEEEHKHNSIWIDENQLKDIKGSDLNIHFPVYEKILDMDCYNIGNYKLFNVDGKWKVLWGDYTPIEHCEKLFSLIQICNN